MRLIFAFICLIPLLLTARMAEGQKDDAPLTRILFVFDASNSMNATWQSDRRITIAQKLLSEAVVELNDKPNVEMALRVYGHQVTIAPGKQDCEDTKLEVPFAPGNGAAIKRTLTRIVPKGTTPIARSLEKAAGDFPECTNCRNIIILITDGIEACDGDPCAISLALQKRGVILKPFVIGVGLDDEFKNTFNCVGNYYDATNEVAFQNILDIVITQALNNTTAQVNLLDDFNKPLETNVTVNFFDENTEQLTYGFVHTLNHKGNPDTISLDPIITYRMEVHTIPVLSKSGISIEPGRHNIIPIDAGQGELEVKIEGQLGDKIPVILRYKGEMPTAHVMLSNTKERVLTDVYDLEILTLPRTIISDVEISQNKTTTVRIPEPGALNLGLSSPGYGSIALINGSALEWVVNIDDFDLQQQLQLQPGRYKLTYRSKNSKDVVYTIDKEFTISSGAALNLKL
jgi:Ca-activated chloride channel family protein